MQNLRPVEVPSATEQGDRRSANRHQLVLRVGLLEQDGRSIFCLVRNISSTGVQIRHYGRVVEGASASLRVGDEDAIPGTLVWSRNELAGLEFEQPLNPQALLRMEQKLRGHRRRTAPRVNTALGGSLRTGGMRHFVTLCDLSIMGARVRTKKRIVFGERIVIEVPGLPSLQAHVRWSDGAEHGLAFQTPIPMQIIADLLSEEMYTSAAASTL